MMEAIDTILEKLCATTVTAADMRRRVALLGECVEEVMFQGSDGSLIDALRVCVKDKGNEADIKALDTVLPVVAKSVTGSKVGSFLDRLSKSVAALEAVPLYVPAELPEAELLLIGAWFRKEISPQALLEVHVDPQVAGGCAVVWKDQYHEFSFRTKVAEHPDIIGSIIREYATK